MGWYWPKPTRVLAVWPRMSICVSGCRQGQLRMMRMRSHAICPRSTKHIRVSDCESVASLLTWRISLGHYLWRRIPFEHGIGNSSDTVGCVTRVWHGPDLRRGRNHDWNSRHRTKIHTFIWGWHDGFHCSLCVCLGRQVSSWTVVFNRNCTCCPNRSHNSSCDLGCYVQIGRCQWSSFGWL
jgi:hypothetical protein